MRELLDEDLYWQEEIREEAPIWNWFVPIILWGGIASTLSEGLGSKTKVLAAIICISLATLITYYNKNFGVKVTMLILLLAMFRFLVFFPASYYLSFGVEYYHIGFDFLLFGFAMMHYVANRNVLSQFYKSKNSEKLDYRQKIQQEKAQVACFKKRFSTKSMEELRLKAANAELVPEAILAAEELILERELV